MSPWLSAWARRAGGALDHPRAEEVADVEAVLALESAAPEIWQHFQRHHLQQRAREAAQQSAFWRSRLLHPTGELRPFSDWPSARPEQWGELALETHTPRPASDATGLQLARWPQNGRGAITALYDARSLQLLAHQERADDLRHGIDPSAPQLWLASNPATSHPTFQDAPPSDWPDAGRGGVLTWPSAMRQSPEAVVAAIQQVLKRLGVSQGSHATARTTSATLATLFGDAETASIALLNRGVSIRWVIDGDAPPQSSVERARMLGVSVRHRWASPQIGIYATQCPSTVQPTGPSNGRFWHVAVSHAVVEVLDADDQPTIEGDLGHVHVSALHLRPTPWLRWRTEQRARWHAHCPACGTRLPTLSV